MCGDGNEKSTDDGQCFLYDLVPEPEWQSQSGGWFSSFDLNFTAIVTAFRDRCGLFRLLKIDISVASIRM